MLPVDPREPSERMALILRDTTAQIVLTSPQARGQIPDFLGRVVIVDEQGSNFGRHSEANLGPADVTLRPNHLAYVIYTSGPTGTPKGVMIEHRALTHRLLWMQRQYELDADDCTLLKTPYTFDVSVWDLL